MKSETSTNPQGRDSGRCPYLPLYPTDQENSRLYLYDVNTKRIHEFRLNRTHLKNAPPQSSSHPSYILSAAAPSLLQFTQSPCVTSSFLPPQTSPYLP